MIIVALSLCINLGMPIWNQKRLREGLNKKTYTMYKFRTRIMDTYDKPYRERYTNFSYFIDETVYNFFAYIVTSNVFFNKMFKLFFYFNSRIFL